MSNELDNIIKEELMNNIQVEGTDKVGKPKKSKVYPKLAGLKNLGRTFFVYPSEITTRDKWVQAQMLQKYGAEIYGEIIKCTVSSFLTVPGKFVKESSVNEFETALDLLEDTLEEQKKKYNNKDFEKIQKEIVDLIAKIDNSKGARAKENVNIKKAIIEKLGSDIFKGNKEIQQYVNKLNTEFVKWKKQGNSGSNNIDSVAKGSDQESNKANPNYSFRIDIKAEFNEEWYKKQFKSGLLNKALDTFKTAVAADLVNGNPLKGHKYDSNTMEPGDERKLDSIKWKMTNKVAKDYIRLLLGCSREKQVNPNGSVDTELKSDDGFGKKMASKALDDRGILGRLKQKIFAGGQDSSKISVAFQLADLYDNTWKWLKESKDDDSTKQIASDDGIDDDNSTETNQEPKQEQEPKQQTQNNNQVTESFDEFNLDRSLVLEEGGHRFESDRYKLVKKVCSNGDGLDELIVNCLNGEIYR